MACLRRPVGHTQLDNGEPTAAYDCGVETTIALIDFASCGKVVPEEKLIRRLMGKPGKQSTNPDDWRDAINSDEIAERFRKVGLRPPKARLLDGVDVRIAAGELNAGKILGAALWYGTLNELAPHKSASRTFGDNHAIPILGEIEDDDRTNEYDPLADGRPIPGPEPGRYPKGPQPIRWSVLVRCFGDVRIRTRDANGRILTERKLGRDLFLGVSLARSKPLAVHPTPDPDPDPIPTPEPDDCQAAIDDALTALASAQNTLDTLIEQGNEVSDDIDAIVERLEAAREGKGS